MGPGLHWSRLGITLTGLALLAGAPSVQAKVRRTPVKSAASVAPSPTLGRVTDVRFWTLGDVTRIAIEIDREFDYQSDRLNNPDRLFFDFNNVKPQIRKTIQTIPVGDALVKQIRVAETLPGTTRVVLDLEASADFTVSHLTSPERLIVEIRAGLHKESPLAAAPGPLTNAPAATPVHAVAPPPPAPATEAQSRPKKIFVPPPVLVPARVTYATPKIDAPPRLVARLETATLPALLILPKVGPPPPLAITATAAAAVPPAPREANRERSPKPVLTPAVTPKVAESVPLPAKKTKSGEPSLTRALGLKLGRIVIDAGHGGHDAGTRGPEGLLEKDLVLDVSRRLAALVESRLSSEVIFTRSDDTFIPLEQRTRIANENRADLFISIHANSSPIKAISGVETYYLNFTTSKTALEVAARENASSERSIYDLKDLVQKIALKDKVDESREFASKVQTALQALSSKSAPAHVKDRGVKKAPFVVLIGATMPSILAEIGFVTNAHDEALMKKPEYRQKIAEALYRGVSGYASGLSHFQVAAQRKTGGE